VSELAPGTESGTEFDPRPILDALERHQVEYVMVGGYAARMHGAARPTSDIDVAPKTTRENLNRVAAALRDLGARIRTEEVPEGLPFNANGESLSGYRMLNLQTPHGDLDLTMAPAAFPRGYDDMLARSTYKPLGEVWVRVAALDDVIRSKEAAGRPKDLEALPELMKLANQSRTALSFPKPAKAAVAKPPAPQSAAERIAAARRAAEEQRRQGPDVER